ncbi:MAG: ABC transporter ATP-binding protein [Pseudomonadota bacterium]
MDENSQHSAIQFQRVSKKRSQSQLVLDSIDLTIKAGELVALIGENGAGKTTLIKTLLDLVDVNSGEIFIGGNSHNKPEARRGMAYLPEQFRPPHFLTGLQFVRSMTRLAGVDATHAEIEAKAQDLALDVKALRKTSGHYSKGMQQKLGLIAALLSGEKWLVLDEPMSGLDTHARVLLKQQLLELRNAGRGILLSTHLLNDAEDFCDHLVVLDKGRVLFSGTRAEFYAAYDVRSLEQAYLDCVNLNQ